MIHRLLLLMLVTFGANSCAIFSSDKDVANAPAELEKFDATVKFKKRWKVDVGGDGKQYLNLVAAFDGTSIFVSDYRGRVQALDAQTGKKRWKTDIDKPVSGGPGVGEGIVLVGSSDGEVIGLSAQDGRELWTAPVTSEVLSVPRAQAGIAGVQTLSGDLIGLDLEDGTRRWIYDRSVPTLTLRGAGSPALSNGLIIGGFASGKLSAIELASGRMVWETSIAVPRGRSELERMVDIDASPQIDNGAVFAVSFQGKVAALDLESGDIIWTREMSSSAGLRVDGRSIFLTDEDSNVWSLARKNGASLWKQEGLQHRTLTAPAPFGEYVAVGDAEGYLHLLSQEDGQLAGRIRVDKRGISAAPFVVDNVLYVLGRGGELVAYEVQKKALKKQKKRKKKQKKVKKASKQS